MAPHCCREKGRCQRKYGTGNCAFRATVCHVEANRWGAEVVVGDRGVWRKVEATGAGVGNASVKIQKDWGGRQNGFS